MIPRTGKVAFLAMTDFPGYHEGIDGVPEPPTRRLMRHEESFTTESFRLRFRPWCVNFAKRSLHDAALFWLMAVRRCSRLRPRQMLGYGMDRIDIGKTSLVVRGRAGRCHPGKGSTKYPDSRSGVRTRYCRQAAQHVIRRCNWESYDPPQYFNPAQTISISVINTGGRSSSLV